jgi:phage tail-like protein
VIFEDPLGAFRFLVSLDPAVAYLPPEQALQVPALLLGAFQEVRGLSADLEVMPYPEGGRNDSVHQLPVRHSYGRITLRRGLVRDNALWGWYQAGLRGSLGARRDGAIIVLSDAGLPAMAYAFVGGLAAKWIGPDLSAMASATAIEGLEIAHQGLEQTPFPGV